MELSSSSSSVDTPGSLPLADHLANASIQLFPFPPTTNDVDITQYIKFKLDMAANNYNKWHNFFLSVLQK
jgi:hypothetical protein